MQTLSESFLWAPAREGRRWAREKQKANVARSAIIRSGQPDCTTACKHFSKRQFSSSPVWVWLAELIKFGQTHSFSQIAHLKYDFVRKTDTFDILQQKFTFSHILTHFLVQLILLVWLDSHIRAYPRSQTYLFTPPDHQITKEKRVLQCWVVISPGH